MFFYDYEPGNILGSRSGQHKLGAVYVSIPCLPPYMELILKTQVLKEKINFELGLILRDNYGIHSITSFIEGFSANYPCLVCKVRKEIMKYQDKEDISLLRNAKAKSLVGINNNMSS